MEGEHSAPFEIQKAELGRLIDEFKEKFRDRTVDPHNFITIHEIERMWGELLGNTQNIYSEIIRELINSQEEKELIRLKKGNTHRKG